MTALSPDEVNDLAERDKMCNLLEEKKNELAEKKKRYSELTSAQFNSNQELIRMKKALKNQIASINAATKQYVDNNVNLALAEADSEYFKTNISCHAAGFDKDKEFADIEVSRDLLKTKLNDYRDLKVRINTLAGNVNSQNKSLRQECLNVGFYCNDIRASLDSNIKKHLDRHHYSNNISKKHIQNTNKSAMTVANRVLDCREEVLGFFRQQLLKLKREERIAQEQREMMERRSIMQENSQAHTENEVESFVKKQKIFPSGDEQHTDEKPDNNAAPGTNPSLQPRPPSNEPPSRGMATVMAGLSSNRGNFVGTSARQRRKERSSPFSAINIDRIGEDLIRGCETEGNTSKLRALKAAMQNNESSTEGALHAGEDDVRRNRVEGAGGQFGQALGKLCSLRTADIANDENYLVFSRQYGNMVNADAASAESALLSASDAREEMLYNACVDGIQEPWNPTSRGLDDESHEGAEHSASNAAKNGHFSAGYRARTMVALKMRRDLLPEYKVTHSNNDNDKRGEEKTYGLVKWLSGGNFEQHLSEILTTEVKSMKDIPIELGLAKVTSIGQTSQQLAIAQIQQHKERERQTMQLAMSNPTAAAASIANVAPMEKRVYIEGLETL